MLSMQLFYMNLVQYLKLPKNSSLLCEELKTELFIAATNLAINIIDVKLSFFAFHRGALFGH